MCAWPPAFICRGLAISTTRGTKGLACLPTLTTFMVARYQSRSAQARADGVILDLRYSIQRLSPYSCNSRWHYRTSAKWTRTKAEQRNTLAPQAQNRWKVLRRNGPIAGNFCSLPASPYDAPIATSGTFYLLWAPSFLSQALPCSAHPVSGLGALLAIRDPSGHAPLLLELWLGMTRCLKE